MQETSVLGDAVPRLKIPTQGLDPRATVFRYRLVDLRSDRISLRRPVEIMLEEPPGGVLIASLPGTRLSAFGSGFEETLLDLKEAIERRYEDLAFLAGGGVAVPADHAQEWTLFRSLFRPAGG